MNFTSLRWKLSLSFAGIALLTTLALGVALLLPLRAYYRDQERAYLEGNAVSIALGLSPLFDEETQPEDLAAHMKFLSFLAQARVRLVNMQGSLIADSGGPEMSGAVKVAAVSAEAPVVVVGAEGQTAAAGVVPGELIVRLESEDSLFHSDAMVIRADESVGVPGSEASTLSPAQRLTVQTATTSPGEMDYLQPRTGLRFFYSQRAQDGGEASYGFSSADRTLISVIPVSKTMYGFELFSGEVDNVVRSDQVLREQVYGADGQQVAWVELSEGPAYGREIVFNVARGWVVASLVAVLVAATAGWWISRRMSAPLAALTGITRRMAGGDLSARASITQPDEYGVLGRSFNEMAARVEGTISTLRHFAADAAHELYTPLTALHTNLELAQTSADPREYLARAAEQVARLEHLMRDLLDLSRIEGGGSDPEPVRMNLARLVGAICEPFAAQAEQAGIDFRLVLPSGPAWVVGQESRLAQALANLVDNALKFTPPGGWVEVGLAVEDGWSALLVEDSGIGIAPEDLPGLFQRFHRGRNAAGYPGSGLGLSIVKAVASAHGGAVKAVSEEGRTRFTLEIPAVNES
jgi:two-component system sensor histidine kinase BaeS